MLGAGHTKVAEMQFLLPGDALLLVDEALPN